MKRLALILILTSLASDPIGEIIGAHTCLASQEISEFTPALAQATVICFLTVLKLKDSGYSQEQNLVINNPSEWQSVWEQIFADTSAKQPLPEVDFTRRTIVAVFQGGQPTTGYEISIEEIAETDASLEVAVKAFAPGRGCVTGGKVTRPLHIVEIEKTSRPVLFHVKHKTRNCQ